MLGAINGGLGSDTLLASDVPTLFNVTANDAGTATGIGGQFTSVENLQGAASNDTFVLAGGQLSGAIDGGLGTDTLIGDNVANSFVISGPNSGTATGVNGAAGFVNVENLTGNAQPDSLTLAGGYLAGSFSGEGDTDDVIGDNVATLFLISGPSVGSATGLGGFADVERLQGGAADDEFWLINGAFSGVIDGGAGSNRIRAIFSNTELRRYGTRLR